MVEDQLILEFITKQFNGILRTGMFPASFKQSLIHPVPKDSGGFPPISLLSCLGKMYDRILTNRIYEEWQPRREQFGCRTGHTTQDATARFFHYSSLAHATGNRFGALFLDFSKAYDRVPHDRLIAKLNTYGLNPGLILAIDDWLRHRTFQVAYNSTLSHKLRFHNGLPQGGPQ